RRLHRLPDVDERMPGDEDVRTGDLRRDGALLRAGNQMVEQHPEAGVGPCAEVADDLDEVVSAFELLDDDALDPQVVTPDRLDELAVVNAFDEDPAGPRDDRPLSGDSRRSGRRTRRADRRRRVW